MRDEASSPPRALAGSSAAIPSCRHARSQIGIFLQRERERGRVKEKARAREQERARERERERERAKEHVIDTPAPPHVRKSQRKRRDQIWP